MDETIAAQVRPTPPSWIWNQPDPNLVNFEESTVLLVTINLDFRTEIGWVLLRVYMGLYTKVTTCYYMLLRFRSKTEAVASLGLPGVMCHLTKLPVSELVGPSFCGPFSPMASFGFLSFHVGFKRIQRQVGNCWDAYQVPAFLLPFSKSSFHDASRDMVDYWFISDYDLSSPPIPSIGSGSWPGYESTSQSQGRY